MNENYTDDELIDQMFGGSAANDGMLPDMTQQRYVPAAPQRGGGEMIQLPPVPPLQMIPLGQSTAPASENILTKKVLGLPLWAVGLLGIAGGGGAWWYFTKKKDVKANDGGEDDESNGHGTNGSGSLPEVGDWSPSRGAIGDKLQKHFDRKGIKGVKVWTDAEEAKKGRVKHISPLVTVCCASTKLTVDKDIQKICSRDGLMATAHEDGSIGCYPAGGKRGKAWEQYIDILREDGQSI
jgi:hypothetical protein